LDQLVHLIIALLLWWLLLKNHNLEPQFLVSIYNNTTLIAYLLGLILVTFFLDVSLFIAFGRGSYERNWLRIIAFGSIYTVLYWLIFSN
jgi:hypothetical protein